VGESKGKVEGSPLRTGMVKQKEQRLAKQKKQELVKLKDWN
jgi:hypothetical protein